MMWRMQVDQRARAGPEGHNQLYHNLEVTEFFLSMHCLGIHRSVSLQNIFTPMGQLHHLRQERLGMRLYKSLQELELRGTHFQPQSFQDFGTCHPKIKICSFTIWAVGLFSFFSHKASKKRTPQNLMRPKLGKGVQETGECGRRAGSILCEPDSDLGSRELRESSILCFCRSVCLLMGLVVGQKETFIIVEGQEQN